MRTRTRIIALFPYFLFSPGDILGNELLLGIFGRIANHQTLLLLSRSGAWRYLNDCYVYNCIASLLSFIDPELCAQKYRGSTFIFLKTYEKGGETDGKQTENTANHTKNDGSAATRLVWTRYL